MLALLCSGEVLAAQKHPPPPPPELPALEQLAEGKALLAAWTQAQYRFSPEVRAAYLAFAKAQAKSDLKTAGKTLPEDFLAWMESDPAVEATVYGARANSAHILLMLRSLELDLGAETVRKKYTQLALALAVVHAKDGPQASLAPRELLKLVIPPCPLKPVNTKDPNRTLDLNDHIINFLNEHLVDDLPADRKWSREAKELQYDEKGVAILTPDEEQKKEAAPPAAEQVKRPLTAADVMASQALQDEFNAYLKAKGQAVEIHCGDHIIWPDRHDAVKGPEGKEILKAFHLFKTAYEAKGLLPAERDPAPTPAESFAFLIRNHECQTPAAPIKKKLPHCPLTAPWPLLTLLAADNQPLREREDLWARYHDKGELHLYGEYIGGIAQQFDFQSARRLSPYPFSYGTFQMMLKDGGVCGTMANMAVRTYEALGVPACTAGQPGHCALIFFALSAKTGGYECQGAQFATGGPEKTHPHTPWFFGDVDTHRDMVYHQSIAWAVNAGFQSYLDSTLAFDLFRLLPEADRKAHGQELVESGLAINPFNFLLADAGQALVAAPQAQIHLWTALEAALAATGQKPGCPANSLYSQTVKEHLFEKLAKLPVPADKTAAGEIYKFLQNEKCGNPEALSCYQIAVEGEAAMLARTEAAFKTHLASARNEASCELMAEAIQAAARHIADQKQRTQWLLDRWQEIVGHEDYFGKKNAILTDAAASALAKLTGNKLRPENALFQPLLVKVASDFKTHVQGERTVKGCGNVSALIAAVAPQINDEIQKRQWLEVLSKIITGHEEYAAKVPIKGGKGKTEEKRLRDESADTIAKLLAPPAAGK
ncbi:MAG: hypothetical protein ABSE73_03855 [Planctomycetota bacterium]